MKKHHFFYFALILSIGLIACDRSPVQSSALDIPATSQKFTPKDTSLEKVELDKEALKNILSAEQYNVICEEGTERSFGNSYYDNKEEGYYYCAACGLPLFTSETKYESGSGWPSFFTPISTTRVTEKMDASHGMIRKEVECARCGGHLGHVFDDGPKPTGLRYCINSASMVFQKEKVE